MRDRPAWWGGVSFTVKAAWLCSVGIARNYSEACSMLARRHRKPSVRSVVAKMEQQKLW